MKIHALTLLLVSALVQCKASLFHSSLCTPCTVTLKSGDDIQAAINSASSSGAVICLEAGVYKPSSTINITKSVELRGPNSHDDPRQSTSCSRFPVDESKEAIIDGETRFDNIINIKADDVTIDGLLIKNSKLDMIQSLADPPIKNASIRYNIITKSGDEGIQLRECESCVVEYNHLFDIAQDAINMCCGSENGTIQFNEAHRIGSDNAAIYIYDADAIHITDNLVYDVLKNDGIKMGDGCSGPSDNGSIERNVVHTTAQDGITVYSSNTLVKDNEIYNSGSENGALYIACQATKGVTVEGNMIFYNNFSGSPTTYGVRIGKLGESPLDTSSITINGNCIQGNEEGMIHVLATNAQDIDATGNWWGADDGPSGQGNGSGDSVSTGLDFEPFLMEAPEKCLPQCKLTSCEGGATKKSKSSKSTGCPKRLRK